MESKKLKKNILRVADEALRLIELRMQDEGSLKDLVSIYNAAIKTHLDLEKAFPDNDEETEVKEDKIIDFSSYLNR